MRALICARLRRPAPEARVPIGRRAGIMECMEPPRIRFQLFLPQDLARQVEELTRHPGTTKSTVLEDAVRAWFSTRAGNGLDDRFALRLDRMARAHEALEQKVDHLTEAVHTFVQYNLTLTADHEPFDLERAQLGQAQFKAFIAAVERRLARKAARVDADESDNADEADEEEEAPQTQQPERAH